jgi:hypothetical protein
MRMHSSVILFLLCSLCTTEVFASTSFGGADCGQWFNEPRRSTAKVWLAGYLSGLNAVRAKEQTDPLGQLSSMEQAFLWVDNYCRANPLRETQDAANALFRELETGKK